MCELLHTSLVVQECFVGDGWPSQTTSSIRTTPGPTGTSRSTGAGEPGRTRAAHARAGELVQLRSEFLRMNRQADADKDFAVLARVF